MSLITTKERNKLYTKIKHLLGYPIRPFEIEDSMMDTYFEIAIENYSAQINEWLIHQQWINLEGLNLDTADFYTAFSTKSNDYMRSFTHAYSKQVGLGTNAPAGNKWELKKDYIITSAQTQHYIIPENRELNEVLWETPPQINHGLVDPFALSNWSS
jgi:hypothetical protein